MLVLMRCVLAFSALAIIWLDPSEPTRLVELTYASLALYCVYSAGLAYASYRSGWPAPGRILHWFDVVFFAAVVALANKMARTAWALAAHGRVYQQNYGAQAA